MATRLTGALATAVKSKAAAVVLATVVAAGTIGAGTVAAAANGAFGQQVKAKVESCKDALANGVHGIGDCVSDFAQQHGARQRQQHSQGHPTSQSSHDNDTHGKSDQQHGASPSATPGAGHGGGQGHGKVS